MNTSLPVYRGEIQCRMLGMAVEAYLPDGTPAGPGIQGELVCTKAFPCQPLGFWPLPGYGDEKSVEEAQRRYYQSYFAEFKGVWCESLFFLAV
jgi:acetoacetyl-CoA synthetase